MANHQTTLAILQFTAVHRYKQKKRERIRSLGKQMTY